MVFWASSAVFFSIDRKNKICLNDFFSGGAVHKTCNEDLMASISDVLKKSIIFNSLEDMDLQRIIPLFEQRELHTGDILSTAGNTAQYFFILERGTLLLAMEEGKSVVLATPGDFIAMELLSDRGRYKTTMTVLEDGAVFSIPRLAFLDLIQEDTPGAAAIMQAWQGYLDQTAPFAKNIADIDVPAIF
jgi:CRP-like cAMP-binding protein